MAGDLPVSWTIDEWFVIALARTIRPRETVFHGFGSPCAQVAMHVARPTHPPDIFLVEGAMYAINPDPPFIPPTSNDASLRRGAVYSMRFEEFFDAAIRGDVDRMFLSGGQIDGSGNTNVTAIGPSGKPKVKLGGGGGGCNLSATIGHLTQWTTRHRSGRTLVEACDFITDIGHRTPAGSRADLGFTGGGPQGAGDPRAVPPPSVSELAAVRSVDPLGVRKSEFSARELTRVFTHGDGQDCAC